MRRDSFHATRRHCFPLDLNGLRQRNLLERCVRHVRFRHFDLCIPFDPDGCYSLDSCGRVAVFQCQLRLSDLSGPADANEPSLYSQTPLVTRPGVRSLACVPGQCGVDLDTHAGVLNVSFSPSQLIFILRSRIAGLVVKAVVFVSILPPWLIGGGGDCGFAPAG